MNPVKDIIFNGDDIVIDPVLGDLKVDYSDTQHVRDIFLLDQGQVRAVPLLGIGIRRQQAGTPGQSALKQIVRRNLTLDNYAIITLTVDANYTITPNVSRIK